MNSYRMVLVEAGLAGVLAGAGCADESRYATKGAVDSLRAQLVATHDTMVALWAATDTMNKVLTDAIDTTPPPPKCPPRCLLMISRIPKMPPEPLRMRP